MKVIIPAAGYGTRMRPHTHTRPKPLVHVAGRPSLDFVLDALAPLPIEELIFIVGRMGDQMEDYVRENYSQYESRFVEDRKSTRLNSSHANISYAVFCLKKKNTQ